MTPPESENGDKVTAGDPEEQGLLDHLAAEFGDRGVDAVAFLNTATELLADDVGGLPRRAGAAAYCLREALKRLLPPNSGGPSWRRLSDHVLDAKNRFEAVRGLPGADEVGALDGLVAAIERLQSFKMNEQGHHQRRLAELVESRTGAPPLRTILTEYQALIREIDSNAVHSDATVEQVRELRGRAVALLRAVFAPFQLRRPELDALARLSDPREEDVDRVLSLCSTQHHLSYFMQQVDSPSWLSILASHGVLDPPAGGGVWPPLFALERLGSVHGQELAAWLEEMYRRWGSGEVGAAYIAAGAQHCLPSASGTLQRALSEHPRSQWIRSQAAQAIGAIDPTDPMVESIASVLLDPHDEVGLAGLADATIQALLDGMTGENADTRVLLLGSKLAASAKARYLELAIGPSGSIERAAEGERRGAGVLLGAVLGAVRRAREIGQPTERTLALLDAIPGGLLSRVRIWALSEAADAPIEVLVREVTEAIRHRTPTGDDVALIDRIVSETSSEVFAGPWRDAMGAAPGTEEVGQALASRQIPHEWQRACLWYPLLPDAAGAAWGTAATLLSHDIPAPDRRAYLEEPSEPVLETAHSPFAASDLQSMGVAEAARTISSWRPAEDRMVIARELARTLEELVSADAQAWASQPLEVLARLRHATYVHHYFEGLARTKEDLAGLGPQLVEAVMFAHTHPWQPERLGDDDFDYDPTWEPADDAGVTLLGRLAERDIDLGDRVDDAWRLVLAAARDRSRGSSMVSPRDDPLQTAINRPCTRALEALFHLVATEFRRNGRVRSEALQMLDEALGLGDWDGAEHRAIIAPRVPFLLHVAPEWVESREALLFGSEAPDDLGQRTLELALKWGLPNRWLLERFRREVLRAVRGGAENAMDQCLVAMLWEVPGYGVDEMLPAFIHMGAGVVSTAGGRLARLLMEDAEPQLIERGLTFWEKTLEDASLPGEAFHGFGWWAEVQGINHDRWERTMLITCERAGGSLDWATSVAERFVGERVTRDGLAALTSLLRGRIEPWDRAQIAEVSLRALRASRDEAALAEERERLRAALTDLGFFDALDT